MPSFKCQYLDKWLHKGQISQEEYDKAIKKLDGHDRQIRADAIDKIEQMLSELPTINGYIDSAYLWLKWEQLKEQKNESE